MSAGAVTSAALPARRPAQPITPGRRRAQYRHAVAIAVEYFNYGDHVARFGITGKAEKWAKEYFADSMSRSHGFKENSDLVRAYPDLLNPSVSPHLRLRRSRGPIKPIVVPQHNPILKLQSEEDIVSVTSPVSHANPKDTEPFPAYTEPLLADDDEMDEILEMRVRQPANKPVMRVTPADLRGTGVLDHLPEFMAQLARANFNDRKKRKNASSKKKTATTTTGGAGAGAGFELDEEQALDEVHVEMDIVAGVLEEKGHDADAEGEDEEQEDAFQLAIPSAGTLPSAKAAALSKAAQLIRPVSSGSSSSSSSSSSPAKIRINVNNNKVKKPSSSKSHKLPTPRASGSRKTMPAEILPAKAEAEDSSTSSCSTSPEEPSSSSASERSSSPGSDSSDSRRRRVIIHTPASRERSRQRSAELEEGQSSNANSNGSNGGGGGEVYDDPTSEEDSVVVVGGVSTGLASPRRTPANSRSTPVRRIILHTTSSAESRKRSRSRSSSVMSRASVNDGADTQPPAKKARLLIEEVE